MKTGSRKPDSGQAKRTIPNSKNLSKQDWLSRLEKMVKIRLKSKLCVTTRMQSTAWQYATKTARKFWRRSPNSRSTDQRVLREDGGRGAGDRSGSVPGLLQRSHHCQSKCAAWSQNVGLKKGAEKRHRALRAKAAHNRRHSKKFLKKAR